MGALMALYHVLHVKKFLNSIQEVMFKKLNILPPK